MAKVESVALRSVAEIERASVAPAGMRGESYVSLEDIDSVTGDVRIARRQPSKSTKFWFGPEHVLYGKLRPYLRKVARPIEAGFCSTDILPIRPSRQLDRDYLFHFLRTPAFTARAAEAAVGVNLPRLSPSVLSTFAIPLPPLSEQRRIAEVLDRAEALRAKRRAALAQLDTLTQSLFLDMFGDPVSSGWQMTTVSSVALNADAAIRTGPFGSQLLHSEFTEEGVAVLGIDNAVQNEFRWPDRRFIGRTKYHQLRRYTVRPGDVLITIMGTCGRCAVVPDDIPTAINTKHLCCISLDQTKCLPVFLHTYFLRHPIARSYLAQRAKGAVMDGLNMGIIKEMPIPLAPVDLQRAFAKQMTLVDRLRVVQRASLAEIEALFAALQHRAFRGEL